MIMIRSFCVYCGSSNGSGSLYREAGRSLGRCLGQNGIRLVHGGGTRGVMGAVAEGVLAAGGSVTGIIPRFLIDKEAPEAAPCPERELVVTEDMHTRKHTMFDKSDAFVALPGGIGTLEEPVILDEIENVVPAIERGAASALAPQCDPAVIGRL